MNLKKKIREAWNRKPTEAELRSDAKFAVGAALVTISIFFFMAVSKSNPWSFVWGITYGALLLVSAMQSQYLANKMREHK